MVKEELKHADVVDGPFVVLFKDGSRDVISEFVGGGMMVGDNIDASYEIHAIDPDGNDVTLLQATIAAVITQSGEQVEFGNPFLATPTGHPRGLRA